MARDIDPELQALLDSGQFRRWPAIVITLGDGTVLRYSRAEFEAGGHIFSPRLADAGTLKMSLQGQATDRQSLEISNLDLVLGQQVIAVEALDGATAMLATAFQHSSGTGPIYYVEKMPGDITTAPVSRERVKLEFVGELYSTIIGGERVGAIFPYRNDAETASPSTSPRYVPSDPNDIPDPNDDGTGRRHGRLPIDPRMPLVN